MKKPNYQNSILNLSCSILKHYNCFCSYKSIKIVDNYLAKNYQHLILMVLDGLGINIIKQHLTKESGLKKNLKSVISSVFPPTTVAATNSILLAKPPFASGYLGWVQYNKLEDANVVVFKNEDYYNPKNKLKTNLREDILAQDDILTLIKAQNPNLHVEALMPAFAVDGYDSFDNQLDRLLMITKGKPSFSYCYWEQVDSIVHSDGVKGLKTREIVQNLNRSFERFINEIDRDVLLIATADHGLVDVEEIDLFHYQDLTATFLRKPSLEPRALTFFIKEGLKEKFKDLFNKYFQPGFLLLSKEELLASELLGYGVKHPWLDSFIGDYIAISISNKLIKTSQHSSFKAHHAGLLKEELEVPLIIKS